MKQLLITAAAVMAALTSWAGTSPTGGASKHLTALFSYATFYHPEVGSYLETYISFDAWNLNFVSNGNGYQAQVDVLTTLSQGDSIVLVKKYELNSPKIASPDADRFNFLDMQRMSVSNGIYNLKITLRDHNSSDEATVVNQPIAFYYDNRKAGLSSLMMMSNVKPTETPNILSRSGYDMEPYINDFLPEQIGQINYYYEVYNINRETRDEFVYAFSYIETLETGKKLESTEFVQRLERDTVIPVFGTVDISALPSGNYNLVVEVRNKSNDIMLYRRLPFVRSNPVQHVDEETAVPLSFASQLTDETKVNLYIEALAPIANEMERRDIYELIRKPGIEEKRVFLYRFWNRREGLNAEAAWNEYRERVDYVNANFSWINDIGIHTDRGRVYLQYGPPDYVRDEKNFVSTRHMGGGVNINSNNSGSFHVVDLKASEVDNQGQIFYLPYQLWRYNQLPGDDINRCFIFWDEFRTGVYKLLNSNAKGEVRDSMWERRLCQQQLNEGMSGEVGAQFDRGY